jgi:carboxypeptidase T
MGHQHFPDRHLSIHYLDHLIHSIAPMLLRSLSVPALTLLLLLPFASFAQAPYSRVKVHTDAIPGGLNALGALGIAVDHGDVKPGHWFISDLSARERSLLDANGHPYEVLIHDVQAHYVDQNADGAPRDAAGARELCEPAPTYPVPQNFGLGSMGGFYTWQEMLDILDAMHAAYPDLISAKQSIGESVEGRPIHFVRISNAPNVDQDKPEVFYNALHHAREPASLSQLILFMWYLLENYGTDAEVTYLVDNLELYFVPCVNPDGYVYNETTNPQGGGMWRKNRRDNGDGTFGVDLNRNYGQGWGVDNSGSSPDPASDVYRGGAPFSEPETQVIRDFCESREFRLTLNYHTFGNLLIYPWGYQPNFYTPDSAVFVNYGALLTRDNGYNYGTANQTVNYVVNGGSDDWMYGEQATKPKIMAMTPEAGESSDGFWPPAFRITDICLVNVSQNLNTAHLAGRYALATDRSPSVLPATNGHIPFDLLRLGQEEGDFTVSLSVLVGAGTAGPPRYFAGMTMLEQRTDSIAYSLSPGVQEGDVVRFVIAVDNGSFTYRDTVSKVIGIPTVVFADNGSSLANWQGTWGVSNTTWFSPPSSITDSPNGNYPNNANRILTLSEPLDLGNATGARLSFMARWDIEPSYDYVQVLASGNNGISWTPLCGRWTRPGSQFQTPGDPVFDGVQLGWVQEEMSLDAFVGGPVRIRFQLRSDNWATGDGFYFDDLRITATGANTTGIDDLAEEPGLQLLPNPASDRTLVRYRLPAAAGKVRLLVRNAVGAVVRELPLGDSSGSIVLHTNDLASGMYTCTMLTANGPAGHMRLVVARP